MLPFYIAFLDSSDELIEIQYFKAEGKFLRDKDKNFYQETEISKKIPFKFNNYNKENYLGAKFIIGFMIEEKKLELIN